MNKTPSLRLSLFISLVIGLLFTELTYKRFYAPDLMEQREQTMKEDGDIVKSINHHIYLRTKDNDYKQGDWILGSRFENEIIENRSSAIERIIEEKIELMYQDLFSTIAIKCPDGKVYVDVGLGGIMCDETEYLRHEWYLHKKYNDYSLYVVKIKAATNTVIQHYNDWPSLGIKKGNWIKRHHGLGATFYSGLVEIYHDDYTKTTWRGNGNGNYQAGKRRFDCSDIGTKHPSLELK